MLEWAALWKPLPKVVFSTTLSAVQGNARLTGFSGSAGEERHQQRPAARVRTRRPPGECSGDPAGGAADESGQQRGEQAAHDQGQGRAGQAGAALPVLLIHCNGQIVGVRR
ncbi:hypothetical protein GCM10010191_22210 [Actinomadura vinacea]|uniref:Uncharacterized protein n=1 Tax=Actinomadura vinacea TaxID=115336 RepID=A0ABN3IT73_9ACTN